MDRRNFFKAFCCAVAATVAAPVVAMLPAAAKKQPGKMYSEITVHKIYKNGMECDSFTKEEICRAFGVSESQINFRETPFAYCPPPGYSSWADGDVIGIKFDPPR